MGARPSPRRSRRALGWVALGIALAALQSIWSVSIPLMAAPDEPSHVIRAAAVARGQWSAAPGGVRTDASQPEPPATVVLPSEYVALSGLQTCFAHQPDQTASCQKPIPAADGRTAKVDTLAGQYPPLYYALVGWPSRFMSAGASVYAMRLVSGLIASALLVWGLYRLRTVTLQAPWLWAAVAAVTPMTLFMGAMVNPQALEISSAFAFWAACLALARSGGTPGRGVLVQAAVTGALLLNSRASGPVWALTIVVVAMVLAPTGRLRFLWGARSLRWALGVAAAAGLGAAAWLATHGAVLSGHHLFPQYASPLRVVLAVLSNSNEYLLQMIGNYGWLDTPSPAVTVLVWSVLVGMLLVLAVTAVSSRRLRTALILSVLAVLAMPVALQVPTAVDTGIIWQGRYTLPVAVGVPMVAAIALTSLAGPLDELVRRIVRWVAVPSAAVAQVLAFLWAMRRYAVGIDGRLLSRSPEWSSPIGYLTAVAIYAIPVAALAWAAWRALRPTTTSAAEAAVEALFDERVAQPVV